MKNFISLFICGVLMLSNFLCVASASAQVDVYSNAITATAGQTLRLPIYIGNNSGILGFRLNFSYDSSVLTAESVEYGDVVDYGLQDNIEGDATSGNMCVYWSGTENVSTEGVWFYINFAVNAQSIGETQINISYTQADTFNEDFEDVVLNCSPVAVAIENDTYSTNAAFSLSSQNITAGDSFYIYLKADSITASGSVIFTLPYDSQVFEYTGFTQSGVKAIVENANGTLTTTATNLDSADTGTNILVFSFKCSENAVSGKYQFNATAVFNSNEAYCASGTTTIKGGNMSGCVIFADDVSTLPGSTVEVPVYISNNHGLMGFRLTFSYNTDLLTPVSVVKGSDMSVGTLNDSITDTYTGSFDVLWNYTESFTANGELLVLSFTVAEGISYSTADIGITYTPTETFNESYEDVRLICKSIDFAITNFIPVEPERTVINPTKGFIFSETTGCAQIESLVTSVSGTSVSGKPDVYGFYGTGTGASVSNATQAIESYTIVIKGDVNGDSACDVLDAHALADAINKQIVLTDAELYSIDFDESGEADIADYQSMVNYMISN